MYDPKDDLYICHETWCGTGVLGYTMPAYRRIYVDALKVRDPYDKLRVEEHEKQHNECPDDSEYVNRIKTDLRLRDKGITTKSSCCFAS